MSRAVVLGPGGLPGTAWLLGLAAGLRRTGIDLADADLIVGTSAGAIAGALLGGSKDLEELAEPVATPESGRDPVIDRAVVARLGEMVGQAPADPVAAARAIGRVATAASTGPPEVRTAQMGWLLTGAVWRPELLITAVDADSGEPVVWRSTDGVPLVPAVTASTAAPGMSAPIEIGGRRYIDGAFRAGSNVDLAAGYSVVVLAEPLLRVRPGGGTIDARQVLRIGADDAALAAFGPDLTDRSTWSGAFRAGARQAADVAEDVRAVWS